MGELSVRIHYAIGASGKCGFSELCVRKGYALGAIGNRKSWDLPVKVDYTIGTAGNRGSREQIGDRRSWRSSMPCIRLWKTEVLGFVGV